MYHGVSWCSWHHLTGTGPWNQRTDAPQHSQRPPSLKIPTLLQPHGRKNQHFIRVPSPPTCTKKNNFALIFGGVGGWLGFCRFLNYWFGELDKLLPCATVSFVTESYDLQSVRTLCTPLLRKPANIFPGYGNFIPLMAELCKRSF